MRSRCGWRRVRTTTTAKHKGGGVGAQGRWRGRLRAATKPTKRGHCSRARPTKRVKRGRLAGA